MIKTLTILLLVYFLAGGLITLLVNRGKLLEARKKNWQKYFVYLFIVLILFSSILLSPQVFLILCGAIIILGIYEIVHLTFSSRKYLPGTITFMVFVPFAYGFYQFANMPQEYLFYALFTTTVFDAFSQLSGQLFGRIKIFPKISPNKTLEGMAGGFVMTLVTAVFIGSLVHLDYLQAFLLGLGIAASALAGDLLASYCKRKFHIKDFSKLIPGHGGFLDRFDSFLATGTFLYIMVNYTGL